MNTSPVLVPTVSGLESWSLVEGWRTAAQLEAVRAIVAEPAFGEMLATMSFQPEVEGRRYAGPLTLLWRVKGGGRTDLVAARITPGGRVRRAD